MPREVVKLLQDLIFPSIAAQIASGTELERVGLHGAGSER
jgi:hypothetical protein